MSHKIQAIVIRRSCLTGRAVWMWCGKSRCAAYKAYSRACAAEVDRVRRWGETTVRRRSAILQLLNECLADIPITQSLTPEQTAAATALRELSREDVGCDREFYNHIIEERRRRADIRQMRKAERECGKGI